MLISFPALNLRVAGLVCLFAALSSLTQSQSIGSKAIRIGQTDPQPANQLVAPNRISARADWSRRQPLRNHLPLWANAQNSTGAAAEEMTLTMVLSRSPEQQAALQQLLEDQKNPASPEFHHWLTPAEFGRRFGLSESDLAAVTGWLQAQGLHVNFVAPSRTFIGFVGPAAAVGHAFDTQVRSYRVHGDARISVSSDPTLPSAIAPVVKAIRGLYTIDEQPHHLITEPQVSATPSLTLSPGNNYITPGDFRTIYDWVPTANGYQQTIGIVGRSRTDFDDFRNFNSRTATNLQMPTEVVPTAFGGVDPGPAYTTTPPSGVSLGEQSEATLDVTRAGSIAPNASILLVVASTTSGGIGVDTQYLVQTSPVPAQIINISYGACEARAGQSGVDYWDTLFEQAAAEGISVFVSSGDSGAAGCEQAFTTPLATPPAISPNYICSSSYVTCVGGTQFNDTANPSQYWGSNNSDNSSAFVYIPEGGWNQPTDSKGNSVVEGTGGGVSLFVPTPKWQTGTGVPAARAGRYTPDVSFSGSCHDPYFVCFAAGGGSCVSDSGGGFRFFGFCGTSASAPSMAGVAALLDEKMQYPQGNINPDIYAMAKNQPSSFHDTTPASSGVATCDIHTPSMCNNSTPGPTGLSGGQAGYALTTGYDLVTGLGSVDISNFLTNFATSLPKPTVTVTPSSTNITSADSLTISVKVDGGSGHPVPTGTLKLSSWAYTAPDATLANGAATFNIPAYTLPWGIDVMEFTAQYVPDSASSTVYLESSGSNWVAVQSINTTVTVTPSSSTVSTAQDVTVTVTVAAPGGAPTPTGMVNINTFDGGPGYTSAEATLSGGSAKLTVPAGAMAPGNDSISAYYQPDSPAGRFYNTNLGSANITVTQAPKTTPTVNTALSASSITLADSLTVTVKVTPASGAPAPTGTVSLTANGATLTAALSGGTAQIVVQPLWLPLGADTLTISYPGDNNNNPVTASTTVTVNKVSSTVTVTPGASTISSDQPLNVQISVTGLAEHPWPTGTVTLTSGSYTSGATTLANGSASITIPSGALATGADSLSVAYSGDSYYAAAAGTGSVTVSIAPPSLNVRGTNITISTPGATTANTSTITITPAGGFTGSVALTAAVTTSPAGAQHIPTLSFGSTSPVTINGSAAVTATLTVTTTATTTSELTRPAPLHKHWYAAGETALAFLVLFSLPARRRRKWLSWTAMLLLAAAALFGMAACGGGGGSSSNPPPVTHPGTTAGTYVVTVTATSGSITANTTLNVTVQ